MLFFLNNLLWSPVITEFSCKCTEPIYFGLYKHLAGIKFTLLFCNLSALSSCPRWELGLLLVFGHIAYLFLLFSRLKNRSVIISAVTCTTEMAVLGLLSESP